MWSPSLACQSPSRSAHQTNPKGLPVPSIHTARISGNLLALDPSALISMPLFSSFSLKTGSTEHSLTYALPSGRT